MNKIAILDYGSQYTHLIATRIRRLGVYSEILDIETPATQLADYGAIILSGGPESVYEAGSATVDPGVFELGKPILGICYGHQLMTHRLGGRVEPGTGVGAEFGKARIRVKKANPLFEGVEESQVWMSHGDKVTQLPEGFEILASSDDDPYSAVGDLNRQFYGLQFHPEVVHSLCGTQLLKNFIRLAGLQADWNLGSFIDQSVEAIREQVGDRNVFMLISGGVDSTVAFSLLAKALGQDRLYGLFVDTGFMRAKERQEVETALEQIGVTNLHVYDAAREFFDGLSGVTDPEEKRAIIGRLFLDVQRKVASELGLDSDKWMLGQGTIYPDTIESGGTKKADKIKTHHNRVPEIEALIEQGRVIEPLHDLYKDEVREVGEKLGLPEELVWRHPFPGPALAVRILCTEQADWPEDHEALDAQLNEFLKENGHPNLTAHTLPIKSVGVQGDFRTYRHPVVLSGPLGSDAGSASAEPWDALASLAPALTNRFAQINRVLYCITPLSSITPSVTPGTLTRERVHRTQIADQHAMSWLRSIGQYRTVWQMPTVLLPVSLTQPGTESVVLRPIISQEAMTAHFAPLPIAQVRELAAHIQSDPQLSAVLYDVTNKPPGTIEWE